MQPANLLAITFPRPLRGAMTTIQDLARYKRQGFIPCGACAQHVRLVIATRMDEQRARGTGSRARRRILAMIAAAEARLKAAQRRRHADVSHDTATEGYARRHSRTNHHD